MSQQTETAAPERRRVPKTGLTASLRAMKLGDVEVLQAPRPQAVHMAAYAIGMKVSVSSLDDGFSTRCIVPARPKRPLAASQRLTAAHIAIRTLCDRLAGPMGNADMLATLVIEHAEEVGPAAMRLVRAKKEAE